jgi:hypothetical protein
VRVRVRVRMRVRVRVQVRVRDESKSERKRITKIEGSTGAMIGSSKKEGNDQGFEGRE